MTAADLTALLKKHPIGAVCLLLSLVCGGLLYFRADAIGAAQADYEAKAAEAAKMSDNVKASPGLEEQVAEIQQLGKELDGRLVKVGQLAVNLQYFYKLEADHGVKLLDVRQNAPARSARGATNTVFAPVPFTVSAQGSYSQLVKFLGALQNGRHLCRITSASFSRFSGTGGASATSAEQAMSLSLNLELLGQP